MEKIFIEDIDVIEQKRNDLFNTNVKPSDLMGSLKQDRMSRAVRKLYCLILLKRMLMGEK